MTLDIGSTNTKNILALFNRSLKDIYIRARNACLISLSNKRIYI